MTNAIGIRLDEKILKKVDILSSQESTDRSTIIRKLLKKGLKEFSKEKAAQLYREGKITLTEASHQADITLWDFQHYLIEKGFVSSYSIEDMAEELNLFKKCIKK